jgi:hypothetical protein
MLFSSHLVRTGRVLALLPFGAVLLLAQDAVMGPPAVPTFKSATRMVLVDVVATDSYGKPVHDLKAADFTVLDNGKAQSIAAFDELRPDGKPRPAAPLPSRHLSSWPTLWQLCQAGRI